MTIPFRNIPLFTFGGIEFDLGGGGSLKVAPDIINAGGPSRDLWLPPSGDFLVGVDGVDALRYGGGPVKTGLFIPGSMIGIGDPADANDKYVILHRGSPTTSRTHTLPDKNGTIAHTSDIPVVDKQHISGFGHRTTAGEIIINAGSAYVQGAGRIVEFGGSTYTYPGTIPNNVTVHVFLTSTGTISVSATNPAAPYFGTARSASGNQNLRYLFSVRSKPSGNQLYIQRGIDQGNAMDVTFLHNTGIDSVIQGSGSATSPTHLTALPWAPEGVTTDLVVRAYNNGTGTVRLFCYEGAGTSFVVFTNIPVASEMMRLAIPCDQLCRIQYDAPGGSGSLSLALLGYRMVR